MTRNIFRSRPLLSAAAILALAALAGLILYFGCGGGRGSLKITAVDANGLPLAEINAMIIGGSAGGSHGVTGTDGTVTLEDPSLSGPVNVSIGSAAYRNYTLANVSARDVTVSLNRLDRPMGYAGITIDDGTWGALADDIPNKIYRFAIILVLFDDVTDILDFSDCDGAIKAGNIVVPGKPEQASLLLPLHQGTARLFAAAGLMDGNNNTFTFFKAGTTEAVIGTSDTCDVPSAVVIPLSQDLYEESSVTLNVTAPMPVGTESPFQVLTVTMPDETIGLVGAMLSISVGAEKVGDNSYRFKAFRKSDITEGSAFYGQDYVTISGFSNNEGDGRVVQSFNIEGLAFSDAQQAQPPTSQLFSVPANLSPVHDSVISPDSVLTLQWDSVDGAEFYFVTLGRQFVNGTVIEDKAVWQGIAPAGTTSFAVPVAGDDTFAGVDQCEIYRLSVRAFKKTAFDYDDGEYPQLYDIMVDDLPVLYAINSATFFTGGTGCGPLISIIWPFGGGAGRDVTISGMYFGDAQGASTVTFEGVPAVIKSWSTSRIVATTPAGAAGTIATVLVTVNGFESNRGFFQY